MSDIYLPLKEGVSTPTFSYAVLSYRLNADERRLTLNIAWANASRDTSRRAVRFTSNVAPTIANASGEHMLKVRPVIDVIMSQWTPYSGPTPTRDRQLRSLFANPYTPEVYAWVRGMLQQLRDASTRCETCERYSLWGEECLDHVVCYVCQAQRNQDRMVFSYWFDADGDAGRERFCSEHLDDGEVVTCGYCGNYGDPVDLADEVQAYGHVCATCLERFAFCEEHEGYVATSHYYPSYSMCRDCVHESPDFGVVHQYSYKPEPDFQPPMPDLEDSQVQPLYMGMELETSFRSGKDPNGMDIMRMLGHELVRDLVYAKRDSSVSNGFEIVTHPMQPAWARVNFPFEWFERLIEQYGALPTHASTGGHIHINRRAFTKSHYWKFVQMHKQLPDFCGVIGGRGPSHNQGSLMNLQSKLSSRERLMELVVNKDNRDGMMSRAADGINFSNAATLELRYPRGGIAPKEIKKNIEWVDASFSFTHYISVADVKDGALQNPGYLLWWINQGNYPNLSDWIERIIPRPMALSDRSN